MRGGGGCGAVDGRPGGRAAAGRAGAGGAAVGGRARSAGAAERTRVEGGRSSPARSISSRPHLAAPSRTSANRGPKPAQNGPVLAHTSPVAPGPTAKRGRKPARHTQTGSSRPHSRPRTTARTVDPNLPERGVPAHTSATPADGANCGPKPARTRRSLTRRLRRAESGRCPESQMAAALKALRVRERLERSEGPESADVSACPAVPGYPPPGRRSPGIRAVRANVT